MEAFDEIKALQKFYLVYINQKYSRAFPIYILTENWDKMFVKLLNAFTVAQV